jgi:DNA-binding NarL/FixJ family response regulator
MARLRLLLADDHDMIVEAFRRMLQTDYNVVGTASNGHDLVEAAGGLKPDLIVADISMPRMTGLEAAKVLQERQPEVKIVLLTMNQDPDYAAEAFRIGVQGYLLKTSAGSELSACLKAVSGGARYLTRMIARGSISDLLMLHKVGIADVESLSAREREVLQLLAEGNSMKEVGAILDITARTVAFHKYRIMAQFHLKSGAELVQFAVHNRLIKG